MNILKTYKYIKLHLLSLLFILFYFSEAYNKFSYIFFGERSNIVKGIKLFFIFYMSFNLLRKTKILPHVFILIMFFCIGQFNLIPNFDNTILNNVLKYIFPILLFAYFNINTLNDKSIKTLQKVFENIMLFNCVLIVLGFLFEINAFRTYSANRFGYSGLLVSSGTATYVTLITIFYFLYKKKITFLYDYKVIFVIISSLLIGTKSIYLGVGLILILYFLIYTTKKHKIIGVTAMFIIMLISIYSIAHYWDKFYFIWKNYGILTSILSYRDLLFMDKTLPFISHNWTVLNYFFGGINDITTRSQMGFIDLFYFFGIIGSIYYLYLYGINYIKYKITKESLLFLLFIGATIAITGNFFLNSSVVVYMLIIRELSFKTNESSKEDN